MRINSSLRALLLVWTVAGCTQKEPLKVSAPSLATGPLAEEALQELSKIAAESDGLLTSSVHLVKSEEGSDGLVTLTVQYEFSTRLSYGGDGWQVSGRNVNDSITLINADGTPLKNADLDTLDLAKLSAIQVKENFRTITYEGGKEVEGHASLSEHLGIKPGMELSSAVRVGDVLQLESAVYQLRLKRTKDDVEGLRWEPIGEPQRRD